MDFTCGVGGHYHCMPEWSWQVKSFPDYDLWLVVNGMGRMVVNGCDYDVVAGDCFVLSPGYRVEATHDPKYPLEVFAIHFEPNDDSICVDFPVHRKFNETSFIGSLMIKALARQHAGDSEKANFWLTAALMHIEEVDLQWESIVPPGVYDEVIEALTEDMDSAPNEPWSVGVMASRCNLSNDHFTRVFKAYTGLAPRDYLIHVRIEKAKHDLLHSSLNVSQIADRLGYSSVYFFSRQFKSKVGMSPRHYRHSLLG